MSESLFQLNRYRNYYRRLKPIFSAPEVQAYTMVTLSLFAITFFGFFAIRPTLKTIATLQRQISDKAQVDQKLEAKINSLIQAQAEYEKIEVDLATIYNFMPEKPEFPSLVRKLQSLAIDNSATISSIQFSPIVLYNDIITPTGTSAADPVPVAIAQSAILLNFNLSFQSDYAHLVTLLDQLTKLERLVTISSAGFSGISSEVTTLTISVQSQAYYYPLNF
ncbi:MAG: hypothetical protein UV61_C0006G0142 [Candidatus Gottesmanbacteria bacterium GW2011_GWB1_43_11]|uniref:Uncharacterized protein n=1 Tax=Candidatus Gottesmanbacteria bacterium GW2011_GWB1_43_11 TaxID=1618446 RepID=A0A0G1EV81_9BACT|nr:MAG: hypothetical protein UV04_C0005G0142 [Candidatus Gottesmanbacteria bacterium GW2011_GWA2_42_16]KKS55675.1 MAG: hypothetical protein UV17_C0008G0026 [Candidatus Gottesmanbacteria bacterium GW2011_GWA1_42_26]KKS81474.1 MAG: hypothetical protein UV55_C0013G0016 [Candidatus Gottesmanbacteria bacterium GW2011_GWC1_43_10]KKS86941.1 MAG: hypothetical protein UV61_C0006G0142 [Candidatus Gottesmanbacteria bacterium GW2011_GWB1_43_11]OGG09513.1 MAG: hypothetical protein A2699_03165 [Candidatus Go